MVKKVRKVVKRHPPSFIGRKLVAAELCLDFANTVEWHASDHPRESLHSYEDLISWCRQANLLDDASTKKLLREAQRHPRSARKVLKHAINLRETIYRIVLAKLNGRMQCAPDLDAFNEGLKTALQHLRVIPGKRGLEWNWEGVDTALDGMLWPILFSAANLLSSEKQDRIGQCADNRGCGWLFLDKTRNRSRRWCDMKDCGNRAKSHRHYRRTQAQRADRGR